VHPVGRLTLSGEVAAYGRDLFLLG
jgi:hypothetical protein